MSKSLGLVRAQFSCFSIIDSYFTHIKIFITFRDLCLLGTSTFKSVARMAARTAAKPGWGREGIHVEITHCYWSTLP